MTYHHQNLQHAQAETKYPGYFMDLHMEVTLLASSSHGAKVLK